MTAIARDRLDATTREELAASLRRLFAEHSGAAGITAALTELGWPDVLAADPSAATSLLFAEHGRALASSRVLDDVLLAELAGVLPPPAGPRAMLYPLGPPSQPGPGLLLGGLDGIAEVVVPAGQPGAASLLVLPAARLAETTATAAGFDAGSMWLTVAADPATAASTAAVSTVAAGTAPAGPGAIPANDAWVRAEAAGRRALAAEIAGVCEAALALATAHTTARVQYGRPIASFQAVRHRLAEAHVAVAGIWATLDAAWAAADERAASNRAADFRAADFRAAWAARIAKMQAGRAQAGVLRRTVQVLGAMGLTREGVMHRYVTRAAALDWLLGDHRALGQTVGADLLAGADLLPVAGI
jgi:Acyl-CoA dehydrogenase, C-terminal domain